jgi:hypothetical protein
MSKEQVNPLTGHVQLLSGAIDKAFKSGVYGVQEAQQILNSLGALQQAHYTKEMQAPPMKVVEDETKEEKPSNKKK